MRPTLQRLRASLTPAFGRGEAEAMIRLIFHALKGWSTTDMLIHEADTLSDFTRSRIADVEGRVLAGEPIQYALGEAYFYGMWLSVGPGVLIPRPETSELVDIIVKANGSRSDLRVLDACCGSGAIAVALARNLPFSMVTAIDVSAKAVEYASRNNIALKTRVKIEQADIFNYSPPDGSFDIIVSNPPYIDECERADMERNVADFEPPEALFVPDANPLIFYRRIILLASQALCRDGRLYFEINPRHASELASMLSEQGFRNVDVISDSYGRQRFASAIAPLP